MKCYINKGDGTWLACQIEYMGASMKYHADVVIQAWKTIYSATAKSVRTQNTDTTSERWQEETHWDKRKEKEYSELLHSIPKTTPFHPVPVFLTA